MVVGARALLDGGEGGQGRDGNVLSFLETRLIVAEVTAWRC